MESIYRILYQELFCFWLRLLFQTFCSDDSKFSEKITPCWLVNMYGCFKGLWWLHIDGQTVQGAMSIDR